MNILADLPNSFSFTNTPPRRHKKSTELRTRQGLSITAVSLLALHRTNAASALSSFLVKLSTRCLGKDLGKSAYLSVGRKTYPSAED